MLIVGIWIVLPIFLGLVAGRLFHAYAGWLDRKHPDNLPLSAGAWLKEQVGKHGLPVRVFPSPKMDERANHYLPTAKMIVLEQVVYFKPDPGAWATAAHELGHAMFHIGNPRLGRLFLVLRRLPRMLSSAAVMMVGCNLLYAAPMVNQVARGMLAAAAAVSLFAIVEEALASRRAIQLLDEDGRLDARGRRAARLELSAALATYITDFVGQLIAIALFGKISAIVEARRFTIAGPLAGWKVLLLGGATIGLGARLVFTRFKKAALTGLWDVPVVVFAALVWDQPGMMVPSLLAAISSMRLLMLVLVPFLLGATMLASWATPRERREFSRVLLDNTREGQVEVAAAADPIQSAYEDRPFSSRLPELIFSLLFLPLVLQYWWQRLFQ